MQARGLDVLVTHEPGGTPFGREIRQILLDREGASREPIAELLLYLADRCQHLQEVIEPALRRGCHVVCDRYHDATLAYQGCGRGIGLETVDRLAALLELRVPDLTLVLDVDVEVGLERAHRRIQQEGTEKWSRFEREEIEFHRRVRQGYHLLAGRDSQRVVLIEASGASEQVFASICRVLEERGYFHDQTARVCGKSTDS